MANDFYNRNSSFNPDELADGDAIEAEFDAIGRGFDTIEDLVNANKAGYPTQTFQVATATAGTHAVPKAQMDTALGLKLDAVNYNASIILTKLKTVDGSSSGLDADLLDGQEGAYYRNASNINAGTLAKERLPASIDASTTGNAATATRLATARQINGVNFDGTANITVADGTKLPLTGGDLSGPITFTPGSGNVLNFGATPVIRRFTGANSMSMGVGGDDTLLLGAGESVATMATNLALGSEDVHIGAETNIFLHVSSDNWATWAGKKTFSIDATNGLLWNGGKVWNAGNDGAGSMLDADLLDGQEGAYYLNAANLNAGILPDARLSGTYTGVSITGNAATATTLQTARTINSISFNGGSNITVEPYVEQDTGTNATRYLTFVDSSTAGYQRLNLDTGLTFNPSTNLLGASISGSAATATTLQTARTINGVSFNGSANITAEPYVEQDTGTNAARYLTFVDSSTAGYQRLNLDTGLTFNPSTNTLTCSVSGNASTASKLATARTITLTGDVTGSVAFDGSANATITAALSDAGVLTSCAAAAAGGVGTYMLAKVITSSALYYGGTYAASVLDTVVYDLTSSQWYSSSDVVLAGTWRCLGYNGTTSTNRATAALFLRIS